jgi:hypothetical protein
VLPYPAGVAPRDFHAWPSERQSEHWVRAAREQRADLLLSARIDLGSPEESHTNGRFWPNIGVLLIGLAPVTWVIDDRSYRVGAGIDAALYDLCAIGEGTVGDLEQSGARVLRTRAELAETTLDLTDRAGGRVGPYVASLLVPAGLLSRSGERTEESLHEKVAAGLGAQLAHDLRGRADEILGPEQLVDFRPSEVEVVRGPNGLELRGAFLLSVGDAESMGGARVRADGGEARVARFGQGEPVAAAEGSARALRYPLVVTLPVSPDADTVQIEVWDASRDQNRRTFTFPIQAGGGVRRP